MAIIGWSSEAAKELYARINVEEAAVVLERLSTPPQPGARAQPTRQGAALRGMDLEHALALSFGHKRARHSRGGAGCFAHQLHSDAEHSVGRRCVSQPHLQRERERTEEGRWLQRLGELAQQRPKSKGSAVHQHPAFRHQLDPAVLQRGTGLVGRERAGVAAGVGAVAPVSSPRVAWRTGSWSSRRGGSPSRAPTGN